MPVTLVNLSSKPFVFSKYHETYCAAGGGCECAKVTYPRSELVQQGQIRRFKDTRLVPVDVTVPAEGRVNGLHEAVLQLPQITQAMAARPPVLRAAVVQIESGQPEASSSSDEVTGERRRGRGRRGQ